MTVIAEEVTYAEPEPPRIAWGWTLAFGIAWIVIGLGILSWNPTTIALISILVSVVVILAGIAELGAAFISPGWKWLHAIAGVAFLVVGVLALLDPFKTFVGLSLLFGWYLVIKGTVLVIVFLATREPGTLWGLGVVVGSSKSHSACGRSASPIGPSGCWCCGSASVRFFMGSAPSSGPSTARPPDEYPLEQQKEAPRAPHHLLRGRGCTRCSGGGRLQ